MEILSRLLDHAFLAKKINFHPLCDKIGLTHLCFANDLIIFFDASPHSVGLKMCYQSLLALWFASQLLEK